MIPAGCEAVVDAGAWPWPVVFRVLMRAGGVSLGEMRRVFNLGIGMIAIVARDDVESVAAAAARAGVGTWVVGGGAAGGEGGGVPARGGARRGPPSPRLRRRPSG